MGDKQPQSSSDLERIADAVSGKSQIREQESIRHLQIRIARDGTWFYQGTPINRMPLVKLFSTVLRREDDGRYWLITPVEQGLIDVDDVPFMAVEMTHVAGVDPDGKDDVLHFRTNLDAEIDCGPDHPLRVLIDPETGEPSPYILVRDGLEARLTRSVFYELADLARERDAHAERVYGVWSKGEFFPLGPVDP
ncbi:MAG: DUF1285 domain-containing protein [Alphaproteobacteria bacterium]|nr:DUF1285 domain-containing protein [Alphaproteobacteria bacterium]